MFKGKIANKKDVISGLCLFSLGLFLAILCFRLSIWRTGPQEGFFPLVIAAIILGLSLLLLIQSVFPQSQEKKAPVERKVPIHISRVLSYIFATLLYGIFLESIGFLVDSALLLVFILRVVEKRSWRVTIVLGSAAVFISYVLFTSFLGVPLPRGLIKAW